MKSMEHEINEPAAEVTLGFCAQRLPLKRHLTNQGIGQTFQRIRSKQRRKSQHPDLGRQRMKARCRFALFQGLPGHVSQKKRRAGFGGQLRVRLVFPLEQQYLAQDERPAQPSRSLLRGPQFLAEECLGLVGGVFCPSNGPRSGQDER
jgi:hypothetical protein